MAAPSTGLPRGARAARVSPPVEPDGADAVSDAVDAYDLAARLEARGEGDRAAGTAGYATTLERASALLATRVPSSGPSGGRVRSTGLADACGRAVIILASVATCLGLTPPGSSSRDILLLGAGAWISGMSVGAAIWRGLAVGGPQTARQAGLVVGSVVLLIGAAVAAVLSMPAWWWWTAWGVALNVLGALGRPRRLAWPAGLIGLLGLALFLSRPEVSRAWAVTAVTAALAAAVWRLARPATRPALPSSAVWGAMALAVVQSAGQIVTLLLALRLAPDATGVQVALAGLVGAALTDPVLESAISMARRVARTAVDWAHGRRRTAAIGVAATVVAIAVSWTPLLVAPRGVDLVALLSASSSVVALTVTAAMLLRDGSDVRAAVASCVTAMLMAGVVWAPHEVRRVLLPLAALALVAAAATGIAKSLSQPRHWSGL